MTWWREAKCRGMDTGIFYPEAHDMKAFNDAVAICQDCPVRDECLDDAIGLSESGIVDDYGIRGGMSQRARANHRRRITVSA